MNNPGQFTLISHYLVHFTQDDLHCLASDSIDSDILFDTNSQDCLVPDALQAIRIATIDLLIEACIRTTQLYRIKDLVDSLTFSWQDANGDILRICNNKKLEECAFSLLSPLRPQNSPL
jgi:hypothetical protein